MAKEFEQMEWSAAIEDDCRHLIRLAVREDLDRTFDWTTVALVPEQSRGAAHMVSRQAGVVAGCQVVSIIIEELNADLAWSPVVTDGDPLQPGSEIGLLSGCVRDLLVAERLVLNLVGHLSGIATLTSAYTAAIAGTRAKIYDTRKTTPGYRRMEKFAVRCGGGKNHRRGLFEAVLIKDNHLDFGLSDLGQPFTPAQAVVAAREFLKATLPKTQAEEMILEIEVDNLEQLDQVLPTVPDIVLLDNMRPSLLANAVSQRNLIAPQVQLEASGGVNLKTVRNIAESGVDRISVGALTHSAASLDIGLDWQR
ncbi:MAG: carboxylating nicotinate-nucleotide diphosphorylase [Planctomycetaceae bacterium]|nr:carboxylating nicotinate-nucleotide diphosphorylase [Planctomycetaceae bacterium]